MSYTDAQTQPTESRSGASRVHRAAARILRWPRNMTQGDIYGTEVEIILLFQQGQQQPGTSREQGRQDQQAAAALK